MENEELLNIQDDMATDSEAPAEEKPVLTPEQKKARIGKLITVITYSIALLCMLAGLFVPLYEAKELKPLDRMYFKYVPAIFNELLYPFAKKSVIPLPEDGFFTPLLIEPDKFSSVALAFTVYAVVCVLGLIMLIPVIAGKNTKRTSAVCAYVVELLAVLSAGWVVFFTLKEFAWGDEWILYNLIIAFGGVLLMMFIQSVYNKGGLGVSKIVLLVLSSLVFFFLINFRILPEGAGKAFNSLSKALGCGESAAFVNGTLYEAGIYGTAFIDLLKTAELGLTMMDKLLYSVGGVLTCVCLFNFAYDALEIVTGSKYDADGVINANKPMSIIAITRYGLALLLAIATIVLAFIAKEVKPGVFLYIVTLLIVIQLIISIVRAAVLASKRRKATQSAEDEEEAEHTPVFEEDFNFGETEDEDEGEDTIKIETPVYEEEYVYDRTQPQQPEQNYQQPYYAQPAFEEPVYEEPQAEEEPEYEEEQPPYHYEPEYIHPQYDEDEYDDEDGENDDDYDDYDEEDEDDYDDDEPVKTEERTYVYNYRAVYNGPTDNFMDTLTDAEKIEFVQVFLEKRKGKIKGVPDYAIGEENKAFFPAVFIHINRSRELVSTRLLEKIYKQIGKNN